MSWPQTISLLAVLIFGALVALLIWTLHREWWRSKMVRRALWVVPLVGFIAILGWAIVDRIGWDLAEGWFLMISFVYFLGLFAILLALPFSGSLLTINRAFRAIANRFQRRSRAAPTSLGSGSTEPGEKANAATEGVSPPSVDRERRVPVTPPVQPETIDRDRRRLVATGAAIIPAATFGTAMTGIALSDLSVRVPRIPLHFDALPAGLDGFKILQVSDLHLGHFITLDHVEEVQRVIERERPDLVLLTGDTADHIPYLPDALSMLEEMGIPHGVIASLGNHEYYNGIRDVYRAFDRSTIPLLVEEGISIDVNGSRLWVGGVDDPARTEREGDKSSFLQKSLDRTIDGAPSDAFPLLMSHRPDIFDASAERGIDLTLAGHTHGGLQMGFNGRSLVETWFGIGNYFWGLYEKNQGRQKLYTSCGAGHWMPFRLGAPRETPLYTLRSGRA